MHKTGEIRFRIKSHEICSFYLIYETNNSLLFFLKIVNHLVFNIILQIAWVSQWQ